MSKSKKIVLVGHFGVGKTSLMRRFVDNEFSEDYLVTLGVQIKKKALTLESGKQLSLIIWDLEGNTSLEKARTSYLLGSSAFLYVFDASRTETFSNLEEEKSFMKTNYPNAVVKVIANKMDLVNNESLNDMMSSKKLAFDYATSAKTGDNVETMFKELAESLIR